MVSEKMKIELLLNPFCLCERDYGCLSRICEKHNVTFDAYNLWDIDDEDADKLPILFGSLASFWMRQN